MMHPGRAVVPCLCLAMTACGGAGSERSSGSSPTIVTAADTQPYSGIRADESVHFTGTEPFWSGQVSGETLTYVTPDKQAGEMVVVDRRAGRHGISFSGDLGQMPFVMAVTPGKCSDGMSDRSYPFTVTLQVRGQQREGCAWTDKQPFTGPKRP